MSAMPLPVRSGCGRGDPREIGYQGAANTRNRRIALSLNCANSMRRDTRAVGTDNSVRARLVLTWRRPQSGQASGGGTKGGRRLILQLFHAVELVQVRPATDRGRNFGTVEANVLEQPVIQAKKFALGAARSPPLAQACQHAAQTQR
jgi:hypothetical protein